MDFDDVASLRASAEDLKRLLTSLIDQVDAGDEHSAGRAVDTYNSRVKSIAMETIRGLVSYAPDGAPEIIVRFKQGAWREVVADAYTMAEHSMSADTAAIHLTTIRDGVDALTKYLPISDVTE